MACGVGGWVGVPGLREQGGTELGLCPQSLIVPGKSPTRKKSGPFGSRRSSAIGIENIQEVQEKRWVERRGGMASFCPDPHSVAKESGQQGAPSLLPFCPHR